MSLHKSTKNQQQIKKDSTNTELDYQTLFEEAGTAMAVMEPDGTFSVVNKTLAELLKSDISTIIGSLFSEWIFYSDKQTLKEYHKRILKGENNIPEHNEVRIMHQDGSTSWALVNFIYFEKTSKTLVSILDINKSKQAEYALKEAISSQNAILSAVPDLMFELDAGGYYLNVWANNPQELAASKKELLGNRVSQILPDKAAKQVMLALREALEKKHSLGRQIYIETMDGKLWFELSVSIKKNEDSADTFIVLSRNITDRKKLETKLLHLSSHDSLTNLYNRRVLEDRLSRDIRRASRYNLALSICMLDIDHFKKVNDTYGHLTGDLVLKKLAKLIESSLRDSDYSARYGGEEFIIVLPETPSSSAKEFAERLRESVETMTIKLEDDTIIKITISVGISSFNKTNTSLDSIINRADTMMYQAKQAGRNYIMEDTEN